MKCFKLRSQRHYVVLLVCLMLGGCRGMDGGGLFGARAKPRPLDRPVQAVWVARFHYRYPDDVRTIMRNCAELGANTVYWQVRGNGTVAYPSALEPWSREFDYRDPGFDPLALAVAEAHEHGLRIEAWINVLPGWKGPQPPPMRTQLWHAHPEWFLRDARGARQPLGDFYLILNPCLPEVRRHIAAVVEEIVRKYDVDGIHLDYVRYAWDTTPNAAALYPRDERTLALFERETGLTPDENPRAWDHWRANQLTRLVADIRNVIDRTRNGASLTAAVVRRPELAYERFLQNAVAWSRTGLVDALVPMAYTDDVTNFESDIGAYRQLVAPRRVVPGVGLYKHDEAGETRSQLARCMSWGGDMALFSYESVYATAQDRKGGASPAKQAERARRRAVVEETLKTRRVAQR